MRRVESREPGGLGAEYEKLVRGYAPRKRSPVAFHSVRLVYWIASWAVSLVVVFVASFAAFVIADAILNSAVAVIPFFGVLIALAITWRRASRDHRGPLVRLIPRSEYLRYARWEATQRKPNDPATGHEMKEPMSAASSPVAPYTAALDHAFPASNSSASAAPDVLDQIEKLANLHEAGAITVEEFTAKKAELLARL
jgi:hypothetical protein